MPVLTLLRHAKSDWHSGVHKDKARPLSARGREDAPRMGRWLAQQAVIPDIILSSSAVRTAQTVAAINVHLRLSNDRIVFMDALYAASRHTLLQVIAKYSPCYEHILLTGHNPGMEELLCFLSKTPPPPSKTGKLMSTAAVAVLRCPAAESAGKPGIAERGTAELISLMRPKELPRETT